MLVLSEFRGELAALLAALIWAIASVIYTQIGRQISPLVLNLVKGLIAICLLILTLLLRGDLFPPVRSAALGLLLLSGAIGIGFGDTAYFQALNCIGPRRTLVLEALAPALAALLALMFLQEQLAATAWLGIGLTIAGVVWVTVERSADRMQVYQPWRGIGFGLIAAFGQASGAVLSRSALVGTDIDPLWSTLVRLVAGVLVLLIWLGFQRPTRPELRLLRSRRLLTTITGTAFASTYLGIWLQQLSLKYAATGVAQALSTTSPLFVIPIAAIWLGEKVNLRAILGVLIALAGVWFLFSRG